MSDLDKVKFLLILLNTNKVELEGAKGAFQFTQAYQWLITEAKKLESKKKKVNKNVSNK